MRTVRALALVMTIGALSAGCARLGLGAGSETQQEVAVAVRAALAAKGHPSFVTADAEGARLWKTTRAFYEKREFAPAWMENGKPRAAIEQFITALWAADHEGLDPQLYRVSAIEARWREASTGFLAKKGFEPRDAGTIDVWLTYLYMKYASDLADGLSDLAHADPKWQIKSEPFDPLAYFETAIEEGRIADSLMDLTPDNAQYRALRKILNDYRQQTKDGGWPAVPARGTLKPGQSSPAVAAIAKRLAASGDYKGDVPKDGEAVDYGPELEEAVKRFQRRHGLQDDGVVGAPTLAEMNVPIEDRVRQIELNLERWRWLPRDLGKRYVLVNIPEYRLEVWEGDRVPITMRVVVGKQDTQTPIFNDQMTHVVMSPYWNVPDSIAQGETLPAVANDPDFLRRQNMEVLDKSGNVVDPGSVDWSDPTQYRFRQRPGTSNSLGLVKFMFPNKFDVYLHDTPADSLFERAVRSFSHGCVRIAEPMVLAEYVLRDQPEWTREKIQEAMHAGAERHVKLREPIPVYLGYWTARVSADGMVQFRKDIYGIDGRQTTLLAERIDRLRKAAAAAETALTGTTPSGKASGS